MKNVKLMAAVLSATLAMVSCNPTEDTQFEPQPITDNFNLLAADANGTLYEIGNNSAALTEVGQIDHVNSILNTASIVNKGNLIYAVQYVYEPDPVNHLLVYNKTTHTTEDVTLTLPENIPGDERGLGFITTDGTKIYSLLYEQISMNNGGSPIHVVTIDLEDYTVSDTGITIAGSFRSPTGLLYLNNNLYLTTWSYGSVKIDLATGTTEELLFNGNKLNGGKMAAMDNTHLAMIKAKEGYPGGGNYVEVDLETMSIDQVLPNDILWTGTNGNGIISNDIYYGAAGIDSNGYSYWGLFKVDYTNLAATFQPYSEVEEEPNRLVILDVLD